jgi:hypothetical protein
MMGIWVPETCWAVPKNSKVFKWHLVGFLFSTYTYIDDARTHAYQIQRKRCWRTFKADFVPKIQKKLSTNAVQEASGTAIHRRDLPTRSLKEAVREHATLQWSAACLSLHCALLSVSQFVNADDNAYWNADSFVWLKERTSRHIHLDYIETFSSYLAYSTHSPSLDTWQDLISDNNIRVLWELKETHQYTVRS